MKNWGEMVVNKKDNDKKISEGERVLKENKDVFGSQLNTVKQTLEKKIMSEPEKHFESEDLEMDREKLLNYFKKKKGCYVKVTHTIYDGGKINKVDDQTQGYIGKVLRGGVFVIKDDNKVVFIRYENIFDVVVFDYKKTKFKDLLKGREDEKDPQGFDEILSRESESKD